MKRYEKYLLIGTFLAFIGVFLVYRLDFNVFVGWSIIIFGKILIIFSVMEYVDYKRAFRGEDLSQDPKYKRVIRKIRKKYY
jgi:hypothetical protein